MLLNRDIMHFWTTMRIMTDSFLTYFAFVYFILIEQIFVFVPCRTPQLIIKGILLQAFLELCPGKIVYQTVVKRFELKIEFLILYEP